MHPVAPRSVASLPRTRRRWLTALAVIVAGLAGSPAGAAAAASNCERLQVNPAPHAALFDSDGYFFETYHWLDSDPALGGTEYGTLYGSGSLGPAGAPPSIRESSSAFSGWGQLFVGGRDAGHQYTSDDDEGCVATAGGRGVRLAETTIDGLRVERTIAAAGTADGGVRLTDVVENPGSAPVTTSVYVGDLAAGASGRLGTGAATVVAASSSGDATISPADRWAVTTDGDDPFAPIQAPPAVAHVWDGPGGRDRADTAQLDGTAPGGGALDADQFGYGWENVTLAPGERATFVSWALLRATANGLAADEGAAAAQAAVALQGAPFTRLYEGFTATQVASVRNWAIPQPAVAIEQAPASPTSAARTLTVAGDASGGLPVCAPSTTSWSLPGGSANGASVTGSFPVGATTVQATVENACSGRTTVSAEVVVAAPDAPAPDAPAPDSPAPGPPAGGPPGTPQTQPLALLSLRPLERIKRSNLRSKRGAALRFTSPVGGRLTLSLKAKGLTIRGKATLRPGRGKTLRLRAKAKQRRALAKARRVTLRATLTTADGRQERLSQQLRLR